MEVCLGEGGREIDSHNLCLSFFLFPLLFSLVLGIAKLVLRDS